MLLNYLLVAVRSLLKNGLFSLINIGGLSLGLAASILIALYVQDETSYDKHWAHAERLFRVNTATDQGNGFRLGAGTSAAVLPALQLAFPDEIVRGSRFMDFQREVGFGELHLEENIPMVDPDFIEMFDFEVLAGDLSAALADSSGIALSAEFAGRIFGDASPLGQVLTLTLGGTSRDYQVKSIYRFPRGNTVLQVPALIQLDDSIVSPQLMANWGAQILGTYVQLAPGANADAISARLPDFVNRNLPRTAADTDGALPSGRYRLELQNVRDLYLNSAFDSSRAGGSTAMVLAFSAISVLVLLIGCINFTVLSTARATRRAREVAVRKTVGASRPQLLGQYLGESFLVVLPAIVLALALVELLLPVFQTMVGKALAVSWSAPETYGALLALFLAVGLAGGLYPAFVLSQPSPRSLMKGASTLQSAGAGRLHNILTVFQFSISIALMAATVVIYVQVNFASNRDPGFNKDKLLVIDDLLTRGEVSARKGVLKQAIDSLPNVVASAFSVHQPTQRFGMANNVLGYTLAGDAANIHRIATLTVGYDFFATYQIPLLAGRDFVRDRDQSSRLMTPQGTAAQQGASEGTAVINAGAVDQLGFSNAEAALGARVFVRTPVNPAGENLTVIGVVADTHFLSLNAVPRAEVYLPAPGFADVLSVRYQGDAEAVVRSLGAIWREVMGDAELSLAFVDQNLAGEFAQSLTEAGILLSFAVLAIAIACLGLFGSAAFNVARRGKEIGIRKVMGAEVREIVTLLLWQFSKPVMFANLVAWPVTVWAMLNWLQRFPYQVEAWLLLPICALAGLAALLIAWLTVGSNTLRGASISPVHSLRYE